MKVVGPGYPWGQAALTSFFSVQQAARLSLTCPPGPAPATALVLFCRIPKPFAFIEFVEYKDAQEAKERMDRTEFRGRTIDVVFAQQVCMLNGPGPLRAARAMSWCACGVYGHVHGCP